MRRISLGTLAIAALLTPAIAGTRLAHADEPALLLTGGAEGDRVFGKAGSFVLSTTGGISWQHQSSPDNASGFPSSVTMALATLNADLFVSSYGSVGVGATVAWSRSISNADSWSDKTYVIAGRLGRAVPLGRFASLWLQLNLTAGREHQLFSAEKNTYVGAVLDLPLLLHPTPHLFVGLGPMLSARASREAQQVWLAGHLVFGGTFGA